MATDGSARGSGRCDAPRIIDAPIELDVYDGTDLCAVITAQTFKIEGYK